MGCHDPLDVMQYGSRRKIAFRRMLWSELQLDLASKKD
jgi:hypothetical protein